MPTPGVLASTNDEGHFDPISGDWIRADGTVDTGQDPNASDATKAFVAYDPLAGRSPAEIDAYWASRGVEVAAAFQPGVVYDDASRAAALEAYRARTATLAATVAAQVESGTHAAVAAHDAAVAIVNDKSETADYQAYVASFPRGAGALDEESWRKTVGLPVRAIGADGIVEQERAATPIAAGTRSIVPHTAVTFQDNAVTARTAGAQLMTGDDPSPVASGSEAASGGNGALVALLLVALAVVFWPRR